MHKKVNEAIRTYEVDNNVKLNDKNYQIIVDKCKKIVTWKHYIKELFEDDNRYEYQLEFKSTNSLPIMT